MKLNIKEWIVITFFLIVINAGYTILYNLDIGAFRYLGLAGPLLVGAIITKLFMVEKKYKKIIN